jgi:hypothetical protein
MRQPRPARRLTAASGRKPIIFSSVAFTIIFAVLFLYQSRTNHGAVEAGTLNGAPIARSGSTYSGPAKVMTRAQMSAFTGAPSIPPAGMIDLPTIPLDEYNAAKALATWSGAPKTPAPVAGFATVPQVPAFTTNFQGAV